MKPPTTIITLALAATLALATTAHAQQRPLSEDLALAAARQPQPAPAAPAQPNTLQTAIQSGKTTFDARLRYEFVDQDTLATPKNANALTLRARLGYTTAPYHGLDAGVLAETIVAIVDNYFDGLTPNPGYPGVADPETTEINQAWLRYTTPAATALATQITAGRQRIFYDNGRFIADVGWRQDNQTFDAITLKNTAIKNLAINYAWLWRVNRVQADQRDWRSDSHLVNLSYAACPYATLAAYAYLLDFHNPALPPAAAITAKAAGTKTLGASLAAAPAITKNLTLNYRLEYAHQTDYGRNPASYTARYLAAELGATVLAKHNLTLGYEQLGSDKGQGFRMPLGNNHAFNGWTDFLVPAANAFPDGLRDYYVKLTLTLPANLQLTAYYHRFDRNKLLVAPLNTTRAYGDEFDASLAYRLNKNITLLAKAATLSGKNAQPDITKFWFQTEYSF